MRSDPAVIAQLLRERAPPVDRIVFETGPLSIWFYHALYEEGLPAICIDARHNKPTLDMSPNKKPTRTMPTAWLIWPR